MSDRRAQGRAVTAWLTHDDYARAQQLAISYGLSLSSLANMALVDLLDEELSDSSPSFRQAIIQQQRRSH